MKKHNLPSQSKKRKLHLLCVYMYKYVYMYIYEYGYIYMYIYIYIYIYKYVYIYIDERTPSSILVKNTYMVTININTPDDRTLIMSGFVIIYI
jgi:hypothetical protein